MPQEILIEIYGEIRETRAELRAHRENSDERNRSIHKRLDRVEDHFRSEIKDLRDAKAPPPSSTSSFRTINLIFKAVEIIYTNWPRIVWILTAIAAFWGVKNPEILKVFTPKQ